MSNRYPLEAYTRSIIDLRLRNLGWIIDRENPLCNVYLETPKTDAQKNLIGRNRPDYVLYETGSDNPIAIIEAKRPGQDLDRAMDQAVDLYAKPLDCPIVFTFNETFVYAKHIFQKRALKIDGEELQDFVDQLTTLRFINEGPEILSAPKGLNYSRDELVRIFKDTNNLLRKEGLRDGYERFSAFAEVLFLKLIDESERLNEHKGLSRRLEKKFCWSVFTQKYSGDSLLDFVHDSVWPRLERMYGDIFNSKLGIKNASTFKEIVNKINPINFTATDTDIKGDAFEYFLKTVTNGNKDLGEYFTPRHITRTMVNLVKPCYGERIYDPFCGTGGFLLEAFKYLTLRVDPTNSEILNFIKSESIFGNEITSTARITKMNMILFGDGHSNIKQKDSLANPVKDKFDVVLSNIPYSQKTEYGSLYPIPSTNGDAVCMQHIYNSLKPNGRAAVIVPETFLYEDGDIGKTREFIVKNSSELSVISLPRGLFMPYTPTKTNIIYFKKTGNFKKCFFFVVHNDGFELNTGRRPILGNSDIKSLLSHYDEPIKIDGQATIQKREDIENSGNWNLRPFYYMEDIPALRGKIIALDDNIILERNEKIDPRERPDFRFGILEVSQNGIFLGDLKYGHEFTQDYKVVKTDDIIYNPYRVNIGSIGVVPPHFNNFLMSPAYVCFHSIKKEITPNYIAAILRSSRYQKVIMNYSLSSARASLPFTELQRIKIPYPSQEDMNKFAEIEETLNTATATLNSIKERLEKKVAYYLCMDEE